MTMKEKNTARFAAELNKEPPKTFTGDQHPDMRADHVSPTSPFSDSDTVLIAILRSGGTSQVVAEKNDTPARQRCAPARRLPLGQSIGKNLCF